MSYDSPLICIDYDVCGIVNGWSLNTTDINFSNSPYTVQTTDVIILVDATDGNVVINLAVCACKTRPSFIIKKIDASSNTVIINASSGTTVQGGPSFTLYRINETAWLVLDPPMFNWQKISNLPEDILTAKGQLIAYNGTNAVSLAPGTNGQMLSADSTEVSGLKWINGGGGGEVNTGANVGTGIGKPFQSKVGTTLQFRSIAAGRNIVITNGATDITIDNIVETETIATSAPTNPTVSYELTQVLLNSTTGGGSVIITTLADGTILGQRKIISVISETGSDEFRVNINTFLNGTALLFSELPDTCELAWTQNGWVIISNSGATVIGGIIPALNVVSYSLAAIPFAAITTDYTAVAYFPYLFSRYYTFKSGTIVFWLTYVDRALSIRLWNFTTSTSLGSLTLLATTGPTSFSVTLPLSDAQLELQVLKSAAGGTSPVVYGVNLELAS